MAEQTQLSVSDNLQTPQLLNSSSVGKEISVENSFDILRERARKIVNDASLDQASTRARLETRYVAEIIKRDTMSQDVAKRYENAKDQVSFYENGIVRIQKELAELNDQVFLADDLDEISLIESKLKFKHKELNDYKKDLKIYRDEFYRILDVINIKESFSDPSSGKMNIGIFSNNNNTPPAVEPKDEQPQSEKPIEVEPQVEETQDIEFSSKPKIETFFDNI